MPAQKQPTSLYATNQAFTDTGSILSLAWTSDGTQVAGAGANGQICFGRLVGLTAEVGAMRAVLTDRNSVEMYHLLEETKDELDFRDRVSKMCLGKSLWKLYFAGILYPLATSNCLLMLLRMP